MGRYRQSQGMEIYYIVCIVVVIVIALYGIWGPAGYLELKKARRELDEQRSRVETLKQSNESRLSEIKALRSDPQALEKYARDKGYSRQEEIIQQLPEK